jgi:hypothetical protein
VSDTWSQVPRDLWDQLEDDAPVPAGLDEETAGG